MEADLHPRNPKRLAALASYQVLDTPREQDFDDIVWLAARICEMPVAIVLLVDADRQWFKAEVGLGVRETPLGSSICLHALLEAEFLEVPDTLADPRTADNPLCAGLPGLRFYAGAPLRTPQGLALGTLCVLDHVPRRLTETQRDALTILARQVMAQLNLRQSLRLQRTLMQEIDHRVKNSLASVMAALRLQVRGAAEPAVVQALQQAEARIGRIALLHEQLSQASSEHEVNLSTYFDRVSEMLSGSLPDSVRVEIDADPCICQAALASQIGVIVTEFALNAAKHAFPDGRAGRVRVVLRCKKGGGIEFRCEDDGIGGAPAPAASPGIGLRLMKAAAQQVGGEMEIVEGGSGFAVVVRIPPPVDLEPTGNPLSNLAQEVKLEQQSAVPRPGRGAGEAEALPRPSVGPHMREATFSQFTSLSRKLDR